MEDLQKYEKEIKDIRELVYLKDKYTTIEITKELNKFVSPHDRVRFIQALRFKKDVTKEEAFKIFAGLYIASHEGKTDLKWIIRKLEAYQ